jgi:hypothetical protein
MRRTPFSLLNLALAGALMALSGCQTAIAPVQVTRFHAIAPQNTQERGSFQMAAPANTLDEATYQEAVRRELQRLGYTEVAQNAKPSISVAVKSARETLAAAAQRSPVSVGVGGGTGGYGGGVGIGLGFNLGGKPKDVVVTQLSVVLNLTSTGKPIWEGRAETRAKQGTPGAQPGLAAAKLANALFANFPGESGRTVLVP